MKLSDSFYAIGDLQKKRLRILRRLLSAPADEQER